MWFNWITGGKPMSVKTKLMDTKVNRNGRQYAKGVLGKVVKQVPGRGVFVYPTGNDLRLSQVLGYVSDAAIHEGDELKIDVVPVTDDGREFFKLLESGHARLTSIGHGTVKRDEKTGVMVVQDDYKLTGVSIEIVGKEKSMSVIRDWRNFWIAAGAVAACVGLTLLIAYLVN